MIWPEAAQTFKIGEVAPHMLKADIGTVCSKAVTANKRTWAKLPAEVKSAIKEAAVAYRDRLAQVAQKRADDSMDWFKSKGGTVVQLSDDARLAWAKSMPNIAKEWAAKLEGKGVPGKAILAAYMDAMRAGGADFSFRLDESEFDSYLWRYDQAGQPLFSWRAPDGYSDLREEWQSATPRVHLWRLCNWLVDVEDDNDNFLMDVVAKTPGHVRTANALADFWIKRALRRSMPEAERTEIVEFMAQGHNPDSDLPVAADWDTQERLRSMVALIFMSPSFLWG